MSNKQSVLQVVQNLPESASWVEITDALLAVVARSGSAADSARLYRTQFTTDHLAEYLNPPSSGIPLDTIVAELQSRTSVRTFRYVLPG
jgi:hypothetical protein